MDWSAAAAILIVTRAAHFIAVVIAAGGLLFYAIVAAPILRSHRIETLIFKQRIHVIVGLSLACAMVTGAGWLLLEAASMSELSLTEAMTPSILSTIVNETQFGHLALVRLFFAAILGCCLMIHRGPMAYGISLAAALGLVASLAWIGHSGSATGSERYVDLGIDILHLVAATAWVGGLLPLLLFLSAYRGSATSIACIAAQRFSILGMVSVATLMLSGAITSVRLVGSFEALGTTDYGRVLTTKLGLFSLMLIFAAINRLQQTLFLASRQKQARLAAVQHLIRNTAVEFALGCCILALVGLLGILHPAAHLIGSAQP